MFHGAVAARASVSKASGNDTPKSTKAKGAPVPPQLPPMHKPHWRMCLDVSPDVEAVTARLPPGGSLEAADTRWLELLGITRAVLEFLRSHAAEELRGMTLVVYNDNLEAVRKANAVMRPPDALVAGEVAAGGADDGTDRTVRIDIDALRKHSDRLNTLGKNVRGNVSQTVASAQQACEGYAEAAATAATAAGAVKQAGEAQEKLAQTEGAARAAAAAALDHLSARADSGHAAVTPEEHAELVRRLTAATAAMTDAAAAAGDAGKDLAAAAAAARRANDQADRVKSAVRTLSKLKRHARELELSVCAGGEAVFGRRDRSAAGAAAESRWEEAAAGVADLCVEVRAAGLNVSCMWMARGGGLMPVADKLTRPWDADEWRLCRGALYDGIRGEMLRAERVHVPRSAPKGWLRDVLHRVRARIAQWKATGQGLGGLEIIRGTVSATAPLYVSQQAQREWGVPRAVWPPDVDLFASIATAHAPLYYSAAWDGGCVGVDAFAHDWSLWPQGPAAAAAAGAAAAERAPVCYAFPPLDVLPAVLRKIAADRPTVWLVLPAPLPVDAKRLLAALPVRVSFPIAGRMRHNVVMSARTSNVQQRPWAQQLRVYLISSGGRAARPLSKSD